MDIILHHARQRSMQDAIIFLERGETETRRLSYSDLAAGIETFSRGLSEAGLAGDPVVIALPAGSEFVAVFLACLHVGAIAIPAPLPDSARNADRLRSILQDSRPAAIITDGAAMSRLPDVGAATRVFTVAELESRRAHLTVVAVPANHPALVQYTSGSTHAPKGIVITHANLVANERMIQSAFGHDDKLVGVNWLPHYHDMGLIGAILQALFVGGKAVLMPPRAFIQKPIRWLKAIGTYGGRTAGGPSFAFDLCTRMISPEKAGALDLSSWDIAYCGSEPVRAAVLEKFARHFQPAGFRGAAFLPCYGLAEATLIATSIAPHTGMTTHSFDGPRSFVSCGRAVENSTVRLRNEEGRVLPADGVSGEICITGPHVSPGRWNGANRSIQPFADTFTRDGVTWLATGDIGRMVNGELYPVDRINDLVIVYGAKIHAADVEATVLDAGEPVEIRAAAAFALDDGSRESLVVLCEVDRAALKTIDESGAEELFRNRVADAHGVVPQLRFVAFGALPRTSSGKIQRSACKTYFLSENGGVSTVASEPGTSDENPHAG
ncbi:MAG: fatty acyl-AMP ligase [Rhizomicrobium sp.]